MSTRAVYTFVDQGDTRAHLFNRQTRILTMYTIFTRNHKDEIEEWRLKGSQIKDFIKSRSKICGLQIEVRNPAGKVIAKKPFGETTLKLLDSMRVR